MPMTKEQMEHEIENLKEKFELLKGQVQLLEALSKQPAAPILDEPALKLTRLIQINTKPKMKTRMVNNQPVTSVSEPGKKYYCKTSEEQQIFVENNPGVETESFTIEVQDYVAKEYLENPDNVAQFTRKEAVNA